MLYLASDHAGYELKEFVTHKLSAEGIAYEDFGSFSKEAVDYPAYAKQLAKAVIKTNGKGILFCGSGQGMAMMANRYKGVRAAVVWDTEIAKETREDNDANVLSLPARFIAPEQAWEIVRVFLARSFSHEERHKRRLKQLDEI